MLAQRRVDHARKIKRQVDGRDGTPGRHLDRAARRTSVAAQERPRVALLGSRGVEPAVAAGFVGSAIAGAAITGVEVAVVADLGRRIGEAIAAALDDAGRLAAVVVDEVAVIALLAGRVVDDVVAARLVGSAAAGAAVRVGHVAVIARFVAVEDSVAAGG